MAGFAAFSGSFRGLRLAPSKRRCLVSPTSGYPTKSVGQAAIRWASVAALQNGSAMTASELYRQAAIVVLVATSIASCTSIEAPRGAQLGTTTDLPADVPPTPSQVASTVEAPLTSGLGPAGFAFPSEIHPSDRYMFYLHGKIIEDEGLPAISPEYGEYRYEEILGVLQSYGFVVISEQRPKDTDATKYAVRVVSQINALLGSGVPSGSITVVGASKGAAIAMLVSNLVADSKVNYVLLGACNPPTVEELVRQGVSLSGNVLAIYDSADEYAGSCEGVFSLSEGKGLGQDSELVVHVGTGHGILYEPLPEWVVPTVNWAKQDW